MKGSSTVEKLSLFTGIVIVVVGFLVIRPVLAQVGASSSAPAATSSDVTEPVPSDASSTPPASDAAAAPVAVPDSAPAEFANTPTEPPPAGLTEVHIIGTKYTDYFTDGTTTVSFAGDPTIDSHLDQQDARIPTHDGMTWVHTTGQPLYDTASGDLEAGDYAVQSDGSYVQHNLPFVSSTSTPATIDASSTLSSPATSPEVLGASTTSEDVPPNTPPAPAATGTPADVPESDSSPTTSPVVPDASTSSASPTLQTQ